jgi:hypothetical protein
MRWSHLQPILAAEHARDLLALNRAEALAGLCDLEDVQWCQSQVARPREQIDPQPLISGDDLKLHGVVQGPRYRILLERVREAQLDGEIHDRVDALALVERMLNEEQHEGQ